jgi:hypothetical protein
MSTEKRHLDQIKLLALWLLLNHLIFSCGGGVRPVAERKQIIRYGSGDAQAMELFRLASSSGAVELRVG